MNEKPAEPPSDVVQAFAAAALTAMQELVRVEAMWEEGAASMEAAISGPVVSASIRLQRSLPGLMTLLVGKEVARQLAAHYLPEATVLTDDLIDDVVGEFANVIAGQAKTILKGTPYHFTMSTPAVSHAANIAASSLAATGRSIVSLPSELGSIHLLIDLPPCPNA